MVKMFAKSQTHSFSLDLRAGSAGGHGGDQVRHHSFGLMGRISPFISRGRMGGFWIILLSDRSMIDSLLGSDSLFLLLSLTCGPFFVLGVLVAQGLLVKILVTLLVSQSPARVIPVLSRYKNKQLMLKEWILVTSFPFRLFGCWDHPSSWVPCSSSVAS